ncbi:DUF3427 domain-containing protein [Acidaminococcus fermentans]|uniref:DUF3427 domain-containing protein n=2 Tax=Acidaminococcus fermentans TaxID=905 RepID=UPI00307A6EA9
MDEYKDGLYEKVISQRLGRKLQQALDNQEIWATISDRVDPQEAVGYLSDYIRKLVHLCLKDLADQNGDSLLEQELALTNGLVGYLTEKAPALAADSQVDREDFLLLELQHRLNHLKETHRPRPATSLSHSFLFTNSQKDVSMVSELRREIASSDRIDFLVSFIKFSGLTLILPYLRTFTVAGGHLRVLTTTYMGATDPKAIELLSQLPNTEVRISYNVKETRLHAKAYLFQRNSGYSTAYVGSSNLSHAAIADGLEWNMKVTQQDMPEIMAKMNATFETYWHSTDFQPYTSQDLPQLQEAIRQQRYQGTAKGSEVSYSFTIRPYPYQQVILDALDVERKERGRWHNLIVAATGTGKTAISAFDYRRFAASRPEGARLLFIAHRKEILEQSLSCFRQVLKDPNFGELAVAGSRPEHLDQVFMSIQTCNSLSLWDHLEPDFYDMIIVDEFHHSAAQSYQKLLHWFQPKILLGLTATPERMDGKDILHWFDDHIAAEIRLPAAIERRLLCPFHYFGVADTVDLSHVKWTNGHYDTGALTNLYVMESHTANNRAQAILQAVERYTADWQDIHGVGFCVSQDHAHFMADYFNDNGIPSLALDAHSSEEDRQSARQKLESGALTFLFVVDLFNEGVDIPCINTILFLRPTNSMTVFLQQLGRGLRLDQGKDCLTVLDFVAQANRKYDFASRFQALVGRETVSVPREVKEGFPHVPKGCSIQLEEIAQKRVLDNIRSRLRGDAFYQECIRDLYEATGNQVPTLAQFLKAANVKPQVFFNGKRTYARLCAQAQVIPDFPETPEEKVLERALPRLLGLDSPHWLSFLQQAFQENTHPAALEPVAQQYLRMWQFTLWGKNWQEAGLADPWEAVTLWKKTPELAREIQSVLAFQFDRFTVLPQKARLPYPCALEVYCNYSRDQIFAALGLAKPNSVREGVKYLHQKNSQVVTWDTDVFLVTLNKSEKEFSESTRYEDYSINDRLFHWQSQNATTPDSPTGQRYIHQREKGNIVLLFVREQKKDAQGTSQNYTFLGTAQLSSWGGSQPITILYHLDNPIPAKYITTTDSSGVL